ncbi:MAG: PepSY domain-containing protein [Pseudomonadota bacterium]
MYRMMPTLFVTASLFAGPVLASDDDCRVPMEDWQSRTALQEKLEKNGWEVRRVKVDDGCYEAEGRDNAGHRFEATYHPGNLRIRELEITFDGDGEAGDYLD